MLDTAVSSSSNQPTTRHSLDPQPRWWWKLIWKGQNKCHKGRGKTVWKTVLQDSRSKNNLGEMLSQVPEQILLQPLGETMVENLSIFWRNWGLCRAPTRAGLSWRTAAHGGTHTRAGKKWEHRWSVMDWPQCTLPTPLHCCRGIRSERLKLSLGDGGKGVLLMFVSVSYYLNLYS